jgi:hypothetical protein
MVEAGAQVFFTPGVDGQNKRSSRSMRVPMPGILNSSASLMRRKVPIVRIGEAALRSDVTRTAHPCIPASQRIRTSIGV